MRTRLNLAKPLLMLSGITGLIIKRQRHNLRLTLLALVGIVLAVGLITNASFFSRAVDRVILTQELDDFSRVTGRPPFSTSAYVYPSHRNPMTLEEAEKISHHVAETVSAEVGLPLQYLGIQVSSGSMMLQSGTESKLYGEGQDFLGNVKLVYVANIAEHMEIVEGMPLDEDGTSGDVLDVWMHDRLVEKMGVRVGETLNFGINMAVNPVPIRLAGFWHAKDPEDDFWFKDPDADLDDALLVRRQDYINFVQPVVPARVREASWYIILDDSKVIPQNSADYLAGFRRGSDVINMYLPGARLNMPPLDPLTDFVQRSTTLTILLLAFNLPAFGILLYFLILISAIVAQWQRKETSILVSRGMSAAGVLNLTLLEQLLLFVIGYPLGIALGMFIARVMGYTASFLVFTGRAPLPVSVQDLSIPLTLLALAFSLLARLWPAIGAARISVVSEERERSRRTRSPFWYRYYLDLLLVLPTWYAYRQLTLRGSLAGLIIDRPEDLYRDPVLILVPAIFVLTVSLLTMRLFPYIMRAIDVLANLTPWLTIHLALRQLGRQGQDYVKPLLLVIVSLAMGVYTLSMAASLDQWLVDRMYYSVGADMAFTPQPFFEDTEYTSGSWIPEPSVFSKVEGVASAARVGSLVAHINLTADEEIVGQFMAIDRLDFQSVAWFRPDFANEPLGELMNRLALAQDNILVPHDFMVEHNLWIGAQIPILITSDTFSSIRSNFTIVGTYDYFPTVYEDRLVVIGNLDYVDMLLGTTMLHDIWLRLESGADGESVWESIPGTARVTTSAERDTQVLIAEEQAKMERVGIFGTLSTGFIAATAMAILGLLLYSYASLQERVYRFAVLHAVGLSRRQIVAQVIMEYAFLAIFGAVAGALIGAFASELFVPFFRFTGIEGAPLPPLLPVIARQEVRDLALSFSLVVVLAEVVTITSVLYHRVIAALKMPWG